MTTSLALSLSFAAGSSSPLVTTAPAPAPAACHVQQDVDFNGYDLRDFPVTSPAECCAACGNASDCAYWSFNIGGNQHCYLKTSDAGRAPTGGVVSGVNPTKPPPPSPAPAPPVPSSLPWKNTSLPVPQRVAALVAAMTRQEKAYQLQTDAPGIDRLQLPAYAYWSEAAHGVAWAGRATVFPCSLAMGATFDAPLLREAGHVVGIEGRAKYNDAFRASGNKSSPELYGLTFFAPNINIVRDVRWGRGQETYGSDHTLTANLAVQYVAGMQTKVDGYLLTAA
jgi:hypothetical protein